jgi:serine/threonine protein kinase
MLLLLRGAETADEAEWASHLEQCADCRHALDELAGAIPTLELAQQLSSPEYEADGALKRALTILKNTARPSAPSPGDATLWFRSLLQPSENAERLGRLGEYEIVELLGQGGMGLVFLAFEPALRRPVAIKVLAPHLAGDDLARERFAREAQAAAAVRHENVVAIHAVEEANGLPFLVMEYVAGGSLQRFLRHHGRLDVETVARLGLAVAAGLEAAHKQGLVHRDIKPANLLIVVEEDAGDNSKEASEKPALSALIRHIKISDFGLARLAHDSRLTQSGTIAGTPLFMSPEQATGQAVDARADLFSLGSVLYLLCTGREPFQGESPLAVLHQVCEANPTPVRELNPTVPEWLAELIERLHAKEPDERLASASEVLTVLAEGLTCSPDQSMPFLRRFKRKKRKGGRRPWWLASGTFLIAGALTVGWFVEESYFPWLRRGVANGVVSPVPQVVLSAHGGPVRSLSFAPGGSLLAAGSDDGLIRLWAPSNGKLVSELTGHEGAVFWVEFTRSGHVLLSGGGGTLRTWDVATRKEAHVLHREGGARLGALSPNDTTVALCGVARDVDLYSLADLRPHAQLMGHGGPISGMAFNNDGQLLATGDSRGFVKFWGPTGMDVGGFRADQLGVSAVAFSPDGQSLATAGTGKPGVSIWGAPGAELRETLEAAGEGILSLAFSPDGHYLAGGGQDGTLFLWHLQGDPLVVIPHAHQGRIFSVAFQPEGKTLASGGEDRRIALWEMTKLTASRP